MQYTVPAKRKLAGSDATAWLKIIALVFMFIDHSGKMLFNDALWMRTLGRIAFPLYCWCIVVGFHYTRSVWKYALRILIVGIISQYPYMLALKHTWTDPNIFLTLLLGLCAIWGIREKKYLSHIWAPAAALTLAVVLGANYGWRGVLLIILFYAAQETKAGLAAVFIAFCLFWGANYSPMQTFLGIDVTGVRNVPVLGELLLPWLRLQALAVMALPLILIKLPGSPKMPLWLSYAIYPAHLLVLWALEQVM